MTRPRVVLLVSSLLIDGPGGGVGRFTNELSRALNPDQVEVRLYALWSVNKPSEQVVREQLSAAGVESFIAADWDEAHPYRSFWRAVRGLRTAFATRPVDILHAHHEFADVAALWLARAAHARVVMRTVHNQEWRRRPLRRLLLSNGVYPLLFNLEAGVSHAIVERLNYRPLARLLRRQARELHNAIDVDRFRRLSVDAGQIRLSLGIAPDALVIGSVGRLSREKAYGDWLDAAARALSKVPQAHFLLVGSGDQEQALKQKAQALDIEQHVTFAGARSDVEQLFKTMDLFVSSSISEGLPTVILESMAAGVAVLATDISGTRELLVNGETGRIVPPGNPGALAEAMVALIMDAPGRAQLAARALQVVERFSIKSVALQHEQLYADLAKGRRP